MAAYSTLIPRYQLARSRTEAGWIADPPSAGEAFDQADRLARPRLVGGHGGAWKKQHTLRGSWFDEQQSGSGDRGRPGRPVGGPPTAHPGDRGVGGRGQVPGGGPYRGGIHRRRNPGGARG